MVKNLPCSAGPVVQTLVRELRSHMPQGALVHKEERPCTARTQGGPYVPQRRPDAAERFFKNSPLLDLHADHLNTPFFVGGGEITSYLIALG